MKISGQNVFDSARNSGVMKAVLGYVMDFESRIDGAVSAFAASLPQDSCVLDAGAGELRHKAYFPGQHYVGVDLAVGDDAWDYGRLDAMADLKALPFTEAVFDAAISIVTLEHVCEPGLAIAEMARVMKPSASLLIVVPMEWEEHQQPYDYFRYTQYGLTYLLDKSGFEVVSIKPAGGIFRVLSRRCFMALKRTWWLAPILLPMGIVLPLFDKFDTEKNSTLGFICVARRKNA